MKHQTMRQKYLEALFEFIRNRNYQKVLDYLNVLSSQEQFQWFLKICKLRKLRPAPKLEHICNLLSIFEKKIDILQEGNSIIATKKSVKWHSAFIEPSTNLKEALNRLQPLIGMPEDWAEFEEELQGPTAQLDEDDLIMFWRNKAKELDVLKKLYPIWDKICEILHEVFADQNQSRKKLSGAALSQVIEQEKRLKKHWDEIVKIVKDVIGSKSLDEFKTKSGNAKSDLYNQVSRRYPHVPKYTLKKWLNKTLKNGKLERSLKNLTTG